MGIRKGRITVIIVIVTIVIARSKALEATERSDIFHSRGMSVALCRPADVKVNPQMN